MMLQASPIHHPQIIPPISAIQFMVTLQNKQQAIPALKICGRVS
jgi:hypothetical protein